MAAQYPFLGELLGGLINDSLRIILKKMGESRSGPKRDLIDRILNRGGEEVILFLDRDDIQSYLVSNKYPYAVNSDPVLQLQDFWKQKENILLQKIQSKAPSSPTSSPSINLKSSKGDVKPVSTAKKEVINEEVKPKVTSSIKLNNSNNDCNNNNIIVTLDSNSNRSLSLKSNNNSNVSNYDNNDNSSAINRNSNNNLHISSASSSSSTPNFTTNYQKSSEQQIGEDFVKVFYTLVNGPNPAVTIAEQGLFFKDGTLNLYLYRSTPEKYKGSEKIAAVFQDFRAANGQFNLCSVDCMINEYGYIAVKACGNVALPAKGVGPFQQNFILCCFNGKWYIQESELKIMDSSHVIEQIRSSSSSDQSQRNISGSNYPQITEYE